VPEPNEAPTAATGSGGRRLLLAVAVVVVAATCAAYASLLGHWFHSDDFAHLQDNRDLGWGGFVRCRTATDRE
jgi:hypothetical protein